MKRSTWSRATLAVVAMLAMAFAGLACCKTTNEPAKPDPKPVVTEAEVAVTPAGVALEDVEEGLNPTEQQELSKELTALATAEITPENVAQALAALEAELADDPVED